jgi:hypothetical protein
MANLTREEIIKRGYVTDSFIVNSNISVDSDLFKAAITDRFYYDLIYGENDKKNQNEIVEIQEPITVVGIPIDNEVVETSAESVLLEEDLKEEVIETPVEPEKKSKKSIKNVEEVDPVEPNNEA